MKRVAWLTDIHLNFVSVVETERFLDSVAALEPEAIFLGGDIAEAPTLVAYLARLAARFPSPVYFVLGNHDYYFGSMRQVHHDVARLCETTPNLVWLTRAGAVDLTDTTGLAGHDGWADARLGDYERSLVMMNDYRLIEELARHSKRARWGVLKALGDEAAAHARQVLPAALATHEHAYFLTHVPPLQEACWHQGQLSNDEWLPHFTCQALGEAILDVMREHPAKRVTVLCGHTHGSGECRPAENVHIITAGAEYGAPAVAQVFEVP